jgi:putative transposase
LSLCEVRTGRFCLDGFRLYRISSATFYNWKAKYGWLDVSDARRLKALDRE